MTDPSCDIILMVTTRTEDSKLREVARELGCNIVEEQSESLGPYMNFGRVGQSRVIGVKTEMGPFSYQGSASSAIRFRAASGATGVIQLGMAFGIDKELQQFGDVLVSTQIIPYDLREVRSGADRYVVSYEKAEPQRASPSLLAMLRRGDASSDHAFEVRFGAMLSGGALIRSRTFLEELLDGVPKSEAIIGGDMEGVGLLSASPRDDPVWIVVKGICDFADEDRDAVIKESRPIACENAARFVLTSLIRADT